MGNAMTKDKPPRHCERVKQTKQSIIKQKENQTMESLKKCKIMDCFTSFAMTQIAKLQVIQSYGLPRDSKESLAMTQCQIL